MRAPSALGPLENNANNSSPPLTCDDDRDLGALDPSDHRSRRYLRRAGLWLLTDVPRLGKCGRCCRSDEGVSLRLVDGSAGFAGLVSCGSVWVCPVCSAKIAARRQIEIQAAITAWYVLGGRVAFTTLTMRHRKGQGLGTLWDAVAGAWGSVTSGKSWNLARARAGLAGWLRLVEVTHGLNGWHVHIHALLFLPAGFTAEDLEEFHGWLTGRWFRALDRRGFSAVPDAQLSRLLDLAAVDAVADYFTKGTDAAGVVPGESPGSDPARKRSGAGRAADGPRGDAASGLSLEFTRSHTKGVRSAASTAPPFTLLDAVFLEGDADALDLWHEWESGSHGRRQLGWSKGLRDLLGLGSEDDDETIASEEVGSSDDDLVRIPLDTWRRLTKRPALIPLLLNVTEAAGLSGARTFLDSHGLAYESA